MDKRQKEDWIAHNQRLQQAYHDYKPQATSRQREDALRRIQNELLWPPFLNYVLDHGGFDPISISRHGMDLLTEHSIGDIDKIARGELDYDY